MRQVVETLNNVLRVPHVEAVGYVAESGATFGLRLAETDGLAAAAPDVARVFTLAPGARYVEVRGQDGRAMWMQAGAGLLCLKVDGRAHLPQLASRVALGIVKLVNASHAVVVDRRDTTPAPVGSASSRSITTPAPPVNAVTVAESARREPEAFSVDATELGRALLGWLSAVSKGAATIGGPVRRNYWNRARKQAAADGALDAFEITLDGSIRCDRIAELEVVMLAPAIGRWCKAFLEQASAIDAELGKVDVRGLAGEHAALLARVGAI